MGEATQGNLSIGDLAIAPDGSLLDVDAPVPAMPPPAKLPCSGPD